MNAEPEYYTKKLPGDYGKKHPLPPSLGHKSPRTRTIAAFNLSQIGAQLPPNTGPPGSVAANNNGGNLAASSNKNLSHVPCKFFKQGICQAGTLCPFSHNLDGSLGADKLPCKYFQKGNCKFGLKCALAHFLPDGTRVNSKQYIYNSRRGNGYGNGGNNYNGGGNANGYSNGSGQANNYSNAIASGNNYSHSTANGNAFSNGTANGTSYSNAAASSNATAASSGNGVPSNNAPSVPGGFQNAPSTPRNDALSHLTAQAVAREPSNAPFAPSSFSRDSFSRNDSFSGSFSRSGLFSANSSFGANLTLTPLSRGNHSFGSQPIDISANNVPPAGSGNILDLANRLSFSGHDSAAHPSSVGVLGAQNAVLNELSSANSSSGAFLSYGTNLSPSTLTTSPSQYGEFHGSSFLQSPPGSSKSYNAFSRIPATQSLYSPPSYLYNNSGNNDSAIVDDEEGDFGGGNGDFFEEDYVPALLGDLILTPQELQRRDSRSQSGTLLLRPPLRLIISSSKDDSVKSKRTEEKKDSADNSPEKTGHEDVFLME